MAQCTAALTSPLPTRQLFNITTTVNNNNNKTPCPSVKNTVGNSWPLTIITHTIMHNHNNDIDKTMETKQQPELPNSSGPPKSCKSSCFSWCFSDSQSNKLYWNRLTQQQNMCYMCFFDLFGMPPRKHFLKAT